MNVSIRCYWIIQLLNCDTTLRLFLTFDLCLCTGNSDHHSQPWGQDRYPGRLHAGEQDRLREPAHPGPLRAALTWSHDLISRRRTPVPGRLSHIDLFLYHSVSFKVCFIVSYIPSCFLCQYQNGVTLLYSINPLQTPRPPLLFSIHRGQYFFPLSTTHGDVADCARIPLV